LATQISARNADFTPQANTLVEVIKHLQSTTATAVAAPAFHAILGTCTVGNVVASGTECVIDAGDYVTNSLGNKAGPAQTQAVSQTLTWVAWTGADGAAYIDGTTVASKAIAALGAAATAVVPATTATMTTSARAKATAYDLSADDDIADASGEYTPFGEAVTLTMTLTGATAAAVVDGYSVTFAESRTDSLGNVSLASTAVISSGGKAIYTVAACADPEPSLVALGGAARLGSWCSSEVTITMAGTGTGAATGTYQPLGYQAQAVSVAAVTDGGYNTSWSDAVASWVTASDALAISTNTEVVSTAGSMIDATATAYDQYGRGMLGKTVTFVVDGTDKITATTGADGNAVYSYVGCTANGKSVVTTNTTASHMATITVTTPGAAGVRGTTVYCVTAAADSSFTDVTGQADVQDITWSADPTR
jgi:hypothetical protein